MLHGVVQLNTAHLNTYKQILGISTVRQGTSGSRIHDMHVTSAAQQQGRTGEGKSLPTVWRYNGALPETIDLMQV